MTWTLIAVWLTAHGLELAGAVTAVLGIWLTYSNVTGDGTLKTIPIPLSVFSPSKQGFIRVSSQ